MFQPEYRLTLSEQVKSFLYTVYYCWYCFLFSFLHDCVFQDICDNGGDSATDNALRKEIKELRDIHKKLYSFTLDRLIS